MPGERGGPLVISVVRRQDRRFCGEPVRVAKLVSSETGVRDPASMYKATGIEEDTFHYPLSPHKYTLTGIRT